MNMKSSVGYFLFLPVIAARTALTAERANELSYTTNLRHGNPPLAQQFHRHVESEGQESDNDCSVELTRDGMSPAAVKRSLVAAKLSSLVYDMDNGPDAADQPAYAGLFDGQTESGVYYESGIDAVYTTRIRNEYCVVAFRGTNNFNKELESNVDVDPVEFQMTDSDAAMCDIHRGFYEAYWNFEYRLSVEDFLHTCSEECPDCQVILTGHSQGGAIAEAAALHYKKQLENDVALSQNWYVITFGAPQGLGAGCLPLFANDERCRFFRYAMTMEGPLGRGLVYDPVPMLYLGGLGKLDNAGGTDGPPDSYARHGGLAFVGHELFLNANDPLALVLGPFDGHYNAETSKYDLTIYSHWIELYVDVMERQYERVSSMENQADDAYECYLPTDGFSIGSLCNPDESDFHCAKGISECQRNGWLWGSENTCQMIADPSWSIQWAISRRFCHERSKRTPALPSHKQIRQ